MLLTTVFALLLSNNDPSGEIPREMPREISNEIPNEIVVVAKPRKCVLSSAGRTLRDADFKRYAAEWAAGLLVRIVVSRAARTQCLAKIMFKLHDYGVTRAEFVDMPGTPMTEIAPARAAK